MINYFSGIVIAAYLFLSLTSGGSHLVLAQAPNQTNCPVMSGPVNNSLHIDYKGKRIYFCCPPCMQKFKQNPDKYMEQLEKEGVVLEETPSLGKK